ncbi:IclR family transcriptional regulator [Dactylosporangium sp. NPDC000555]|uniref:IclR family transcriptional regulator n=1 Tax=Dactylosporangium sp. NPDC000555 TaxID=3154260 RepID=UPI003331A9AF
MNVVVRTLEVLSLIAEAQEGYSLTQVSEKLGYPLPTTHRILALLMKEEFVRRDPTTLQYFSGRRLQRMAALARRDTLASTARVNLQALSEQFNETVLMTQLIDGRAVCVALSETRRPLHLSVAVGQAVPLHAAASARVLYSELPEAEVAVLLEQLTFVKHAPGTPANVTEVIARLKNIREYGYDVCDNEFDLDVWAAAAPIHNSTGAVVAGLALTTPQERSRPQDLRDRIIRAVVTTAEEITLAIGGTPTRLGSTSIAPS